MENSGINLEIAIVKKIKRIPGIRENLQELGVSIVRRTGTGKENVQY
jgi:hypothetical protein